MKTTTTRVEAMLAEFQQAWSSQDTDAVLDFFPDELDFEDLEDHLADDGVVVTKWRQSGTMTAQGNGFDLRAFPYEVVTTSIIKLNDNVRITSVSDNWNAAVLYQ